LPSGSTSSDSSVSKQRLRPPLHPGQGLLVDPPALRPTRRERLTKRRRRRLRALCLSLSASACCSLRWIPESTAAFGSPALPCLLCPILSRSRPALAPRRLGKPRFELPLRLPLRSFVDYVATGPCVTSRTRPYMHR